MAGTVITKKGMQLLVKLIASESILKFTRVAVGTGTIQKGYDPASMVDLAQYKMDGMISECQTEGDVAKITMQISSEGIETGFTMTEMGVFAEDPDLGEILYAYLGMGEDPQYIYAEGGEALKFVEVTLEVAIEAATKVSTYINPASMVLRKEFDERLQEIEGKKLDKVEGKGLSTNDFTNEEKNKLDGIEAGANNYTHPETHPAEMIGQDSGHRMVTDAEKAAWDAKQSTTGNTANNTAAFSSGDTENPTSWTNVAILASGEKHSSIFSKVSNMFKNVRFLKKRVDELNTNLAKKQDKLTNPLIQADVVDNLSSAETQKPLSANQGKILNDKISQKSRVFVQMQTITGNGSDWAIVSNAGKYLITAQTVREDTSFYVKGINKQNAAGVYTLIFSENIPQSSKQAVWITWID